MKKPVKLKFFVDCDHGQSTVTANLYLSSSMTGEKSFVGSVEVSFDEKEYRSSEAAERRALGEVQERLSSVLAKFFNESA